MAYMRSIDVHVATVFTFECRYLSPYAVRSDVAIVIPVIWPIESGTLQPRPAVPMTLQSLEGLRGALIAAFERPPRPMRVRQGGHDVPPEVIRRRFHSSMRNFLEIYRQHVDYWQWFDNSGPLPRLLEEGANR